MIIRKMTANFGVLSNASLELDSGLNVIQAPNESGKSTWCAFMRVMLYGTEQSRRGRDADRQDKSYAPWNGTPASGEMELLHEGKEITLHRYDTAHFGEMRGFRAVYTGTDIPVSGLSDADAGEILTGVSLPVFRRTAFISAPSLAVDQSPELEKKIAAIISSGEEGSSYSQTAERLRSAQRRIRYHSKGLLPALEDERRQLQARNDDILDSYAQLEAAERQEDETRAMLNRLQRSMPQQVVPRAQRLAAAQDQILDLQRQLMDLRREEDRLSDSLRRGPLRGKEPTEETRQAMRSDQRRAKELEAARAGRPSVGRAWLWCLAVAAVFAAAGLYSPFFLIGTLLALAGGAAAFQYRGSARDRRQREEKDLGRLMKKYGASRASDIPGRYDTYVSQWERAEELSAEAEELRAGIAELTKTAEALGAPSKDGEETCTEEFSRAEDKLRRLSEMRARVQGKLDALGDPVEIKSRLHRLDGECARLEGRYAALELALTELEKADEEMNSRFAPALSREAEEIFTRLTGGKYGQIALDRDLSAAVRGREDAVSRSHRLLSRGTREQLYLALRLALCDLMPADEPCPIILDDALIYFDDERMVCALDYLKELARHRQIILFTCQSREKRYLASQ